MCLDMFLNDASLPYQYLGDSQAENYEKYKHIASLENTLKTKDEHIAYIENTLKTKDEHIERINNSLINLSGGLMAQISFPQGSQFVPQGPQVIARTIPPLIVPKAFTPSVPKAFQHMSGRAAPY